MKQEASFLKGKEESKLIKNCIDKHRGQLKSYSRSDEAMHHCLHASIRLSKGLTSGKITHVK